MTKQCYQDKRFRPDTLDLIETINSIVDEYESQGYVLTTRQLYYQLVARDIIPNNLQEYKRAAAIINDAKLAGLIDWDMLEDRTRSFIRRGRWTSPTSIIDACAEQYHQDMWVGQSRRVFVIVEKEALVGVLERVCHRYDTPLLAARGYPSSTVLREFAINDILPAMREGQSGLVLHLGDHDPSGIDMTRDLLERLRMFGGHTFDLKRIALNIQQVEELQPPENPAKSTDSRFSAYLRAYGESSWELDALPPQYLDELVSSHIDAVIDKGAWNTNQQIILDARQQIQQASWYVAAGCPDYEDPDQGI
ncbi:MULTISPECIES: hypothetical protein [Burkholderia cepacia complex]|uniref:hypothetical protein n=1 Tax=Burkholderia cepacia complex TaxID=87882 RepID=UPI0007C6E316|nr:MULTISPECIES: hypothetical protein [Burkholderia cepacia complex]MBR8283587.1 hypothetical protein [Burkholderia vietnamiensis]